MEALDPEQRAALLQLLRHEDPALSQQGVELLWSFPAEIRRVLLRGAELSRANLTGADLSGFDLTGAAFRRTVLREASLVGATLAGAELEHAVLQGADLSDADLSGARLHLGNHQQARLVRARLRRATLHNVRLPEVDLTDADLTGADLRSADLSTATLTGCALAGCLFDDRTRLPEAVALPDTAMKLVMDSDLAGAELSERPLHRVHLPGADLSGADLHGSVLAHARMEGCVLRGADLTGAELRDVRLASADLSQARLGGATLHQVNLSGAALDGADLRGAVVSSAELARADLAGARLAGARFEAVSFIRATVACSLAGVSLVRCGFKDAVMPGADLRGAVLTRAVFSTANLTGADLSGVSAKQVKMRGALLSDATLREADLWRANLREADLAGADLRGAVLVDVNLRGADLTGADLRGADLRRAGLQHTCLHGADLTGADLRGAGLSGADLSGARLEGARLEGALCDARWPLPGAVVLGPGVDLSGADLRGVWLVDTDLREANLSGADLQRGSLWKVDLRGADLTGAVLDGCRMSSVHHDIHTRWPAGFVPPTPPALLQPQPRPQADVTVRAALERGLSSADEQIQQRAALALARMGAAAEALRARLPSLRAGKDRSDELMTLAAHGNIEQVAAVLPEGLPGREGALIASKTAAMAPRQLAAALLHPGRQGEHRLARAAHRMVLRELRSPCREAVIKHLRAAIPQVTLGDRALRRLRVVDGLRGVPPEALRDLLRPGLVRGKSAFMRAVRRTCRRSSLADDAVLSVITSLEQEDDLRKRLIALWDAPAARHRWLRQTVCDPATALRPKAVLARLLLPDTDRDVLLAAARAEPTLIGLVQGPVRPDLAALLAEQLDAGTLAPAALYRVGEAALGAHRAQIAPRAVAAYVRGQAFLKPVLEALSRRAPEYLQALPTPLPMGWPSYTARAMLQQSEAQPPPPPEPVSRRDLFRHDAARRKRAAAALLQAPDAEAFLREALRDPGRQQRALLLVGMLAEQGRPLPLVDAVCALLVDGSARDAARALRWMGDASALAPLAARAMVARPVELRIILLTIAEVLQRPPSPPPS